MAPRLSWIICCVILPVTAAAADPGVTADTIRIGESAALSGPAAGLGTGMRIGLEAAFAECAAAGGVHGRKPVLIARDDGYDPDRCVDCTLGLLNDDHVFALAGYVGTPTAKVALPIIADQQVPLVGIFSGAKLLRDPVLPNVFNLRASYDDETEALVAKLVAAGRHRIAVFYQNDAFGEAGLGGTIAALQRRNLEVVAKDSFERNTVAVRTALATLEQAAPDAVIMVAPYQPVAAFLTEAEKSHFSADFATLSFVGTENLIAAAGPAAEGVLISQVVPPPSDTSVPLVKAYVAALAAAHPDASPAYTSLEGYADGRLLLLGLDQAGDTPTRAGLRAALEAMHAVDLGGLMVTFSATDHQGSAQVFLSRIKNGKAVPEQ